MSTLTKILIVLLTISSIFLCGIVVTYVANADDYQQKYKDLKSDRDALRAREKSAKKQLKEKNAQMDRQKAKLNSEISSLRTNFQELENNFDNTEREKSILLQKVNSWTSIAKDFTETNDKQGNLLKNTLTELNELQTKQIKQKKELDETSTTLMEKLAIIETLTIKNRRLLEGKSELQNKIDRYLAPVGRETARPTPVTPEAARSQIWQPAATRNVGTDIGLNGLINAIDLKNSMATISIGTADGVREGMRFHVTRGEKFVCDILIIDVSNNEAVGILELMQERPKVGDNAATNL